jgi:hypothetical protein
MQLGEALSARLAAVACSHSGGLGISACLFCLVLLLFYSWRLQAVLENQHLSVL